MTNSADPDQLASGSMLFAKTGHVMFSKRRVKKTSKLWHCFCLFFVNIFLIVQIDYMYIMNFDYLFFA